MIRRLLHGHSTFAKLFRYGIAGGVSSLFYGACAWCLVHPLAVQPVAASVMAYLLAIPVSFTMQRRFAFRSQGLARAEMPRFLLVHGVNIAASAAVMRLTVGTLHADPLFGVVATMLLIPLLSFAVMNLWVFPHAPRGGGEG